MNFKITFQNQIKFRRFLIIISYFIIFYIFYLWLCVIKKYDVSILYYSLIALIILKVPNIYLYFEYLFLNFNNTFTIGEADQILSYRKDSVVEIINYSEIKHIQLWQTNTKILNKKSYSSIDDYYFVKITLNSSKDIYLGSIMLNQKIEVIKQNDLFKNCEYIKTIFPSIFFSKWLYVL